MLYFACRFNSTWTLKGTKGSLLCYLSWLCQSESKFIYMHVWKRRGQEVRSRHGAPSLLMNTSSCNNTAVDGHNKTIMQKVL